jgi:hypothetical protein
MSDTNLKEQAPTREELEREARRLERSRHLTLVTDSAPEPEPTPLHARQDLGPDPQTAA